MTAADDNRSSISDTWRSNHGIIEENSKVVSYRNLAFITLVANIGALLFGYDFGATSWLLSTIDKYAENTDDSTYIYFVEIANSNGLTGLIAAASSIGATITYIFLLFLGNDIPKRDEIQISALLYFVGALLESSSGDLSWETADGFSMLLIGRLIYGAGIAAAFHSVPQYCSEWSSSELRGMVGAATEAMAVTGVVLGYVVGYIFQDGYSWIVTFRVGYIIAFFMGILALIIPQSPSWMVRNKCSDEEVMDALHYIFPNATDDSIKHIKANLDDEQKQRRQYDSKWRREDLDSNLCTSMFMSLPPELKVLVSSPTLVRCLLFALTLVVLQICTGQSAILYFAGDVFGEICPDDPDDCILGLGISKLVPAYTMIFIGDSLGRREFLIGGSSLMVLGLGFLCYGISIGDPVPSLLGIYTAVIGYEISFGTMLWILLSEIFPQFVRSAANSIAVATLFALSTVITFTLPYFEQDVGLLGVFILFTVFSGVAVIVLLFFAPETRGADLEIAYKKVDITCNATGALFGCPIDNEYELVENRDNESTSMLSNDIGFKVK